MGLFGGKKKSSSFLGVDVGAGGIKVVELSSEKGRPKLMTFGYSVRGAGEATTSPFEDTKKTGEILADVCQKAGVKSTQAMAALPLSNIFSTIISVQRKKDEKEMKPLIDAQITKLTPLPLNQMVTYSTFIDPIDKKKEEKKKSGEGPSDGSEAGPGSAGKEVRGLKKKESDYVRVLITGAAQTLVQKYIEIFRNAKLELQAIDSESFALIRSLIGKDKGAIMILDIGSVRSNITIVEKGIPFLTRSINIGGSAITKKIMQQMGVSEEQAEQMKMDLSGMADPRPLIEATLQPILHEINYSFDLYSKLDVAEIKQVEKVIITGGTSMLPQVPEYLSDKLNLNVYRGDPWARVIYPQDLRPVLDEIGPRMAISIGLAMREMD